jgi:hypothetical protein
MPNIFIQTTKGITTSLICTLLLSYFMFLMLLLSVNDFPDPSRMKYIVFATLPCYLVGTILLDHTNFRRDFFSSVILYSFLFYFYGRIYHLSNPILLNSTYILYLLRAAVISVNKFSFQFEQLTTMMNSGLTEVISSNIVR